MSIRDPIDILLKTLIVELSTATGISSGSFWADHPSPEFLNGETYNRYPSVGIIELDMKPLANNYGTIYVTSGSTSGMVKEFLPIGEVNLTLQIQIFSELQSQRREYRTKLNQWFYANTFVDTLNDSIPDQSFSIIVEETSKSPTPPYTLNYTVCCIIQDFAEQESYRIDEITLGTTIGNEINVDEDPVFGGLTVDIDIN